MTGDDVRAIVRQLQTRRSELDDVEVKSTRGGTPQNLWKTISAFANRPGGGTLLFGLDPLRYEPTGISDLDQLQSDVSDIAQSQMEPPVQIAMGHCYINDHVVLAVNVSEVPSSHRPCYYRTRSLFGGSYIRSGDGDRPMTEYEVHLLLSSRGQPVDDRNPVDSATLADLEPSLVENLLGRVRTYRADLATAYPAKEDMLKVLNVMSSEQEGHPTLAGLIALRRFPQRFFPNLVMTVTAYAGPEADPVNRLELDLKCESALPKMLDTAMTAL